MPRVLFSAPECRIIAVELQADEEMGDHHVRERALVTVVAGRVSITSSGTTAECPAGTLVVFEPGELHRVSASTDALLLLVLAPWPAPDHFPEHVPANAVAGTVPPNDSSSAPPDRA
jgi:quercetin dioxygenase-like cupin family protein